MSIFIKIRIAALLAAAGALFAWPAWWLIDGAEPRSAVTVLLSGSPVVVALVAMVFVLLATAVGLLIGRGHAWAYALAAGPAGLTAWALRGAGARALLVAHPTSEARREMYIRMGFDVLVWGWVVLVGFLFAYVALRYLRQRGAAQAPARMEVTAGAPAGGRGDWLGNPLVRDGLGLALTLAGALVLLTLLAQSYETWVETNQVRNATLAPAAMQGVFAVAAAFFLAALGVDQLFNPRLEALLPGPVILGALLCWWAAGQVDVSAGQIVPQLLPGTLRIATISPVAFVGAGVLAVQGGYWYSRHLHRERRQALAAQADQKNGV